MVNTPTIREFLLSPEKMPLIHSAVAEGVTQYGMQTFDQSVLGLLQEGVITEEEAIRNCNNPNELSLKLKGISATSDRLWSAVEAKEGEGGAPAAVPGSGRPDWMSKI
jgi:twitching motility protein PilT